MLCFTASDHNFGIILKRFVKTSKHPNFKKMFYKKLRNLMQIVESGQSRKSKIIF